MKGSSFDNKHVYFHTFVIKLAIMFQLAIILAFGLPEWGLIVLAVLLLFGGRKIPELMKGLGQGIREFNNAKKDVKKHIEDGMTEPEEESKK
jgi:sec-independent protein translocase protein TatA